MSNAADLSYERIRAWLDDPETTELSENDKKIWERLDYAYDQLKITQPANVARRMQKKFGISYSQARRDIRTCERILSPANRRDADWLRNFIIEDAIKQIKSAEEKGDHKSWQRARADLIRMYSLEKDDQGQINPQELGNNTYYVLVNLGHKAEKIDMNKIHKLPEQRKVELTSELFRDIDIEEAKIIQNS